MGFEEVIVENKSFRSYRRFNEVTFRRVTALSRKLKGRRVFHINSTAAGGGVAELLKSQIPLERNLGINSRWLVLKPSDKFFVITKKMHNLLQGRAGFLSKPEKQYYLEESGGIARSLDKFFEKEGIDLLVVHDPQPLVIGLRVAEKTPKLLRLHIDLSTPNVNAVEFFHPYIENYDFLVVSRNDYRFLWFSKKRTKVIMPAIDPLSDKNVFMRLRDARGILMQFGINPDCPLVTQVSRLDPWKDPLGVIDSYYHAKNHISRLQLVLVGFFQAVDDPEAREVFKRVKKHARGDPDIILLSDTAQLEEVGIGMNKFINAAQTASDVILQKSIREGFGLTVTEAMWKGKPVIGGNAGGIRLQIKNGKNGFIVSDPVKAAHFIVKLLKDKKLRERIGRAARKTVARKFLLPGFLRQNLEVYQRALK